jgi:hypothetical protein
MNANQLQMLTAPECWLVAAAFIISIALGLYGTGGKSRAARYTSLFFVAVAVILFVEFLWRIGAFSG